MRVESLNLHGLNLQEAREKTCQNVNWVMEHGVEVLVINHGKGYHSANNFAILKSEIRKLLKEELVLPDSGYRIIYGESDWPVTLTFDEGNTLVVAKGAESSYLGGKSQQSRNERIFSEEAKKTRRAQKNLRKHK